MQLGIKFITLVVIILSITLAITTVFYVRTEKNMIEEQLIERGKVLGHFVSLIVPGSILSHDYLALNKFIKESTSQRDVVFGVILNSKSQPITSYYDKHLVIELKLKNSDPVSSYKQVRKHIVDSKTILPLRFPITHEGNDLGEYIIGISRDKMLEQLTSILKQRVMSYFILILVMVISIYFVFRRSVLIPIKRLINGSKSVAHGNLDTIVEKSSNDELGELTDMFNYMTSEIRHEQQELSHQASYDSLTNLPNRMLANDRLKVELKRAKRENRRIAVMFIDLNNFKIINDTMGHATGDLLLVEVSQRMKKRLRDGDTIARLGGDEFVVILPTIDNLTEVEDIAERMLEAVEQPFRLGDRDVKVSYSIGVALYPEDGNNVEKLMANADNAMYQAKAGSARHVRFFSQEMNDEIENQLQLEQGLHDAINNGELALNFQPIIDVKSGQFKGAEVLLRWNHPQRGMISPEIFIPMAEMTGQIIPIGKWVIREAARCISEWQSQGLNPNCLSVNISRVQLQEGLISHLRDVMSEFNIDAKQLMLEITESVLMENVDIIKSQLDTINDAGIRLSLDDFGTGFSSLSYLKNFPFYSLKLDRSFVEAVPDNKEDTTLVSSIIALAKGLNLQVVAEGIECEEQLQALKGMGCDTVQGYYIGRPMDQIAFKEYLVDLINQSQQLNKITSSL